MNTVDPHAVGDAVSSVRRRIHELSGDRVVQLIAVTKGFGLDAVDAVVAAGCHSIGESYAQELRQKFATVDVAFMPEVHFIGRLQTNKVTSIAGLVDVWHSVDRIAVADAIASRATAAEVFVQVNTTGEPAKGGCDPTDTASLVARCQGLGLAVLGLMTVGPTSGDSGLTRSAFVLLRRQADDLGLAACSMGMSHDFEIAVEQGSTHVRIGSALFGERPLHRPQMR